MYALWFFRQYEMINIFDIQQLLCLPLSAYVCVFVCVKLLLIYYASFDLPHSLYRFRSLCFHVALAIIAYCFVAFVGAVRPISFM